MIPHAMLATPIRFDAPSYTLRVTVDGLTEDLPFNVVVGRNYWAVDDGQADADGGVGGVGSVYAHLESALQGHSNIAGVDVTLDANFRVLIAPGLGTFAPIGIDWDVTGAPDPTPFGWPGGDTGGTQTSPHQPRGLWRPGMAPTEDSRERQPIVGGIATSVSGRTRVSRFVLPRKERDLEWLFLDQSLVLDEFAVSDAPYNNLEHAWVQSLSLGRPARYYADETDRAVSAYGLYTMRRIDEPFERDDRWNRVRWRAGLGLVTE